MPPDVNKVTIEVYVNFHAIHSLSSEQSREEREREREREKEKEKLR
jgi:hypothetical protein